MYQIYLHKNKGMSKPKEYNGEKLSKKVRGMDKILAKAEDALEKSGILVRGAVDVIGTDEDVIGESADTYSSSSDASIIESLDKQTLEERDAYIVLLLQAGHSSRYVLKAINKRAIAKRRPQLKHPTSVMQIYKKHLKHYSSMDLVDQIEDGKAMRQLAIDRLHAIYEKLTILCAWLEKDLFANNKINFVMDLRVYVYVIETMMKIQQNIIDNQNWNHSRMNPNILVQDNSNLNITMEGFSLDGIHKGRSEGMQKVLKLLDDSFEGVNGVE